MVIPRLVSQAILDRELTTFGDGSQTRCFCDVEAVVAAVNGLLDTKEAIGEVYNVGSEEEVSIKELAERILEQTGSSSTITHPVCRGLQRSVRGHAQAIAGYIEDQTTPRMGLPSRPQRDHQTDHRLRARGRSGEPSDGLVS